jgi:hypothetical protein
MTLEAQYVAFLRENGDPNVSYEDWLVHLSKQLTETLYQTKTEKLQHVKANDWARAKVWRDFEVHLEEQLKEIKQITKKDPIYIYESPDKGETVYRREKGNYENKIKITKTLDVSTEERIAKILNQDNNIPATEVLKYLDDIWRYKEIEVYDQMTEEEIVDDYRGWEYTEEGEGEKDTDDSPAI